MPIEAAIDALKAKGIMFKGEMATYTNVKIATLLDPDGNAILIVQQP
jgi:hypothetical protein